MDYNRTGGVNTTLMKNQMIQIEWDKPFLICELPKEIKSEVNQWIRQAKKIKNHPLSALKAHQNFGYQSNKDIQNAYQCSLPINSIQNSFWLAYVLRVCAFHWGGHDRDYCLREWRGHYDGLDIWANFSYKGNGNPIHQHSGFISGVIYHKNNNHPTIFPDYNKEYCGKNGTMILFSSDTRHYVDPQPYKGERTTIAFNINRFPAS